MLRKININQYIYYFIIILRILSALLIFRYPLVSMFSSFFLDLIDGEFASKHVLTLDRYEQYDKLLDFWWYLMTIIYVWINLPIYQIVLTILFGYRMIGEFIFLISDNRKILVFFPNFYENFFFLYFFVSFFSKLQFLIDYPLFYFTSSLLILSKVFQEWLIHWAQLSVGEWIYHKKKQWLKK